MAFQDGLAKYNGVMRFLREHKPDWNIRLDRMAPSVNRPTIGEKDSFNGAIIDGSASTGMARAYVATPIPLVAIDWRHPEIGLGRRRMVHITSDNAQIGRIAAKTLLETSNFTTFAFCPLSDNTIWSIRRGEAFVRALRHRKASVIPLDVAHPLDEQLLKLTKPAAVFAANDDVGAKVLQTCSRIGIAVPEDLSVLGVDNEQFTCLHTNPPLASIQPDFERAGYIAAQALANMLDRQSVKTRQTYHIKGIIPRGSMEPSRSAGRLVQRALELINDPQSKFGSIDGLAKELGVSRRLLDLRFREIRSCSVLDAIRDARMNKVCSLLSSTNLSIAEICKASQLGSGTHPLRAFRKRFGMTMRDYRNKTLHPDLESDAKS